LRLFGLMLYQFRLRKGISNMSGMERGSAGTSITRPGIGTWFEGFPVPPGELGARFAELGLTRSLSQQCRTTLSCSSGRRGTPRLVRGFSDRSRLTVSEPDVERYHAVRHQRHTNRRARARLHAVTCRAHRARKSWSACREGSPDRHVAPFRRGTQNYRSPLWASALPTARRRRQGWRRPVPRP